MSHGHQWCPHISAHAKRGGEAIGCSARWCQDSGHCRGGTCLVVQVCGPVLFCTLQFCHHGWDPCCSQCSSPSTGKVCSAFWLQLKARIEIQCMHACISTLHHLATSSSSAVVHPGIRHQAGGEVLPLVPPSCSPASQCRQWNICQAEPAMAQRAPCQLICEQFNRFFINQQLMEKLLNFMGH